jgi:hypothetical protein
MTYRTPFITETNEPHFTDCQFCSGLMPSSGYPSKKRSVPSRVSTLSGVRIDAGISLAVGSVASGIPT